MSKPGKARCEVVKGVLRFIRRTVDHGLYFQGDDNSDRALVENVNADYAYNLDTRKSNNGFVFILYGTTISWKGTQ